MEPSSSGGYNPAADSSHKQIGAEEVDGLMNDIEGSSEKQMMAALHYEYSHFQNVTL